MISTVPPFFRTIFPGLPGQRPESPMEIGQAIIEINEHLGLCIGRGQSLDSASVFATSKSQNTSERTLFGWSMLICWPSCELRCFCGFPLFWQAWLLSLEAELLGSCGTSSILHHMYSDSVGLLRRTFLRLNDYCRWSLRYSVYRIHSIHSRLLSCFWTCAVLTWTPLIMVIWRACLIQETSLWNPIDISRSWVAVIFFDLKLTLFGLPFLFLFSKGWTLAFWWDLKKRLLTMEN